MYLLTPQWFSTCTTCIRPLFHSISANTSKSIVFCIAECIVSILTATMTGWSVKHCTRQQDCLVKQRLSKSNMPLWVHLCEHIMPQHTLCPSAYKLFIIIKVLFAVRSNWQQYTRVKNGLELRQAVMVSHPAKGFKKGLWRLFKVYSSVHSSFFPALFRHFSTLF